MAASSNGTVVTLPSFFAGTSRLDKAEVRRKLRFTFDGQDMWVYEGQTIAAALLAAGQRVLRRTSVRGEPRGAFCGMGVCFDCLVQVDGRPNVQACRTVVSEGMRVESQQGVGGWEPVS